MRRGVYGLFCVMVVAALATYAWRGWYARYITDDFCTAGYLRKLGYVEAMKFHRENWSGRYAYFPIKGALESIGNVTTRFTPTVLMILLAAAVACALRRLLAPRAPLLVFAASIAAVYALVDGSPSMLNIAGSWYWETGALTYILPLVLFTFWYGLFAWKRPLGVTCAASAAIMFVAGGLSETTLASQGAITGILLAYALWQRQRREAWIAAAGLIATLVALVIMSSAGGNIARGTIHTDPRPPGETILLTLDYANRFIGWHVFPSGAALLPLMAIAFALGMRLQKLDGRLTALAIVTALAAYLSAFVPSAWLLPWTVPERALDVPNYFIALALFAAALWAGFRKRDTRLLAPVLLLTLIVPLLSIRDNVREIPSARTFAGHFDSMDRQLRGQKGKRAVLKNGQWALGPAILGPRESFWVNECVCLYYGLKTLRVER